MKKLNQSIKCLRGMPLHLENVARIKFGKTPLDYLCVNLPPVCNYRCEKCFTWANEQKMEEFIGTKKVLSIITEAKRLGVKTVGILGEGEPLLFKDIKKIVKHIHDLKMIPLIATNGSLLTKGMARFLYAHGASIAVSLDTLDEKMYKKTYRGDANLDKVLENLNYARKIFAQDIEQTKNGFKVYRLAVHMTVTAKNVQNLEAIKNFCGEDIYFSCEHIAKIGVANDNPDVYGGKSDIAAYRDILKKTRSVMDPMVLTRTGVGKDTCCFYYYGFAVGYEGEVMLDTHAVETKYILGNVNSDTMDNLVKKSQAIKDDYYKNNKGHYCIIRDPNYQKFVASLRKKKGKKLYKPSC